MRRQQPNSKRGSTVNQHRRSHPPKKYYTTTTTPLPLTTAFRVPPLVPRSSALQQYSTGKKAHCYDSLSHTLHLWRRRKPHIYTFTQSQILYPNPLNNPRKTINNLLRVFFVFFCFGYFLVCGFGGTIYCYVTRKKKKICRRLARPLTHDRHHLTRGHHAADPSQDLLLLLTLVPPYNGGLYDITTTGGRTGGGGVDAAAAAAATPATATAGGVSGGGGGAAAGGVAIVVSQVDVVVQVRECYSGALQG